MDRDSCIKHGDGWVGVVVGGGSEAAVETLCLRSPDPTHPHMHAYIHTQTHTQTHPDAVMTRHLRLISISNLSSFEFQPVEFNPESGRWRHLLVSI